MTWFIRKGSENVTIYDSLDFQGNGNIRFSGTIDAALTMYAMTMAECDEQRKRLVDLEKEVAQLKTQLTR